VTLTKQHKRYLAVLGLAVVALSVDRLFLAGAGGDSAKDLYTIERDEADEPAPVEPTILESGLKAENALGNRLLAIGASRSITPGATGDAFAAPASWELATPTKRAKDPAADDRSRFDVRYRLVAVMLDRSGQGRDFVTIQGPTTPAKPGVRGSNGRITLFLDDSVEGYRLVEIHGRAAVFEGLSGRVSLAISDPADGAGVTVQSGTAAGEHNSDPG
jgi:hypothetical protein